MIVLGGVISLNFFYTSNKQGTVNILQTIETPSPTPTINFSIETPPRLSLKGKVASLSSNVFYISRSSSQEQIFNPDQQVLQGETIISSNSANIQFSFYQDNLVKLSEKTSLEIIQSLPNNIVYKQISGNAYYKISNQKTSVIITPLLLFSDSGEFTISIDDKRKILKVTVSQGEITIAFNDTQYNSIVKSFKKRETLSFDLVNKQIVD